METGWAGGKAGAQVARQNERLPSSDPDTGSATANSEQLPPTSRETHADLTQTSTVQDTLKNPSLFNIYWVITRTL